MANASSMVLKRPDGSHRVLGGYRYAAAPSGTKSFDPSQTQVSRLPAQVDLRPMLTPVEDQGQTSSCAANAAAGAYEYLMKRHQGDQAYDVSRLFIYFNARDLEGGPIEDGGSLLHQIVEGLKQYGAPSEQTWPFDPGIVNEKPSDDAYQEASGFSIEGAELVPVDLDAWKTSLAAGYPIIFGMALFESFDKQKKAGLVPMPTPNEVGRASHGGHAMLCVGYSDKDQVFIVRNSWGPKWGDKGYCYIPYRYLMNADYNYGDSWIIRSVEMLPTDESTWSDGSESLLEDVTTALGNMDDETYSALVDAAGEHHIETRLAALFLACAGADGDLSEAEVGRIAEYLGPVLQQLGGHQDGEAILQNAGQLAADEALLSETVQIFGQYFPAETLASIANQLQDAAGADGLDESEASVLDAVIAQWQVGTGEVAGEDDDEGEALDGEEEYEGDDAEAGY